MKKIYLVLSFLMLFGVVKAQFPTPYCSEAYVTGVEPITSVTFGTILNTSSASLGGTAHEDYTSISTNVTSGGIYAISVEGNTDGSFTDYIRVFIDWNQNGDFLDAGESFDIGKIINSTGVDGKVATANITIPLGATVGTTRMRVSKKFNAYQSPCNTSGYGESEDYTIVVIAAAGCTGSPIAGIATGPSQACVGSSIALNLSGSTVASAIRYQWQTTSVGGTTWTNLANDTTQSVVVLQGASGADYRCLVTCISSNITNSSARVSVAVQTVNCPPVNDLPCNATTLVLDGPSDCQNTTNATSTDDPTSFGCSTPNNTTWYKYTPSVSGDVMFTLSNPITGKALNGWLGVYTVSGTCPGALIFSDETNTVLGGCKSYGGTAGSSTSFIATLNAGTEYYFMVDGVSGDIGSYCIAMKTPPSPPASCVTNTLPANNATNVTGFSTTFKWTAVATATNYDLYIEAANPPTTLSGNYTTDSAVVSGLTYNTQYYWYVVPKNTGGSATGCDATNVTSFTTGGVPASAANDEPCDAITLVLDGPKDCRNTAFATTSANDPTTFSCSTPNNTLWYKYTPTSTADVLFRFTPPATGNVLNGWLGVYSATGTCPGSLTFTDITSTTLGACKSFLGSGVAFTEFTATLTAGTEYYFMIDGVAGAIGEYCFAIQTPPNPPTACATNITPANAATAVPAATTLKWSAVASAASYNVYLGTVNPPTTSLGFFTSDSVLATGLAYSTTYYWYVVPTNGGGSSTGCDVNVTSFTTDAPPPPPANDDICSAIPLVLNGLSDCQNTTSATSTGDPSFNCSTPNNTVWYSYTPTSTGVHNFKFTIPAASAALNGWLGVYTSSGGCSGTLTDVTTTVLNSCQSFGTVDTTTVAATLTSGTEYFFMVDGVSGAIGSYCIALKKALPPSIASIAGRVITPTKKEIQKVVIKLNTASSKDSLLTAVNGTFNFGSLATNDYIIKPVKNNDIKKNNGVSSIDVILTTSHILNKVKLNSPYKLIAADVNNNKTITNIDLIFMKRVILGIDTTFTGNRLWTFVDSAYQFADTTNPFPYKDSISITNLASNKVNQSFIGIKLGDVNYDWNPALARGGNKKDIELIVKTKVVTEEGEQKISFATKNFNELLAMQYTLNFNNKDYEFLRIENNKLGIEFNTQQSMNGKLGFLWSDSKAEDKSLVDGSEIFTLVLRPKNMQCKMCDTRFALTNDITEIEGWDKYFNQHNIVLKINIEDQAININRESFSVSPNPTSGEIMISLMSNTAKKVMFELSNTIGKTLYTQCFETIKGKNVYPINLHKHGNLAKGLYFIKAVGLNNNPVVKIIIE
jgi:hypothetical protein